MMLIAILLPWLSFFLRGKIITGIICLILQATLIGWLPAAIWAALSLNDKRQERRTNKLIKALNRG
jgi:TM2 domain-containing membrane protein YozV